MTETQRRLVIALILPTLLQLVGLMIDGAVTPNTGLSSILIDTSGGLIGMALGVRALRPRATMAGISLVLLYLVATTSWLIYLSLLVVTRVFGRSF